MNTAEQKNKLRKHFRVVRNSLSPIRRQVESLRLYKLLRQTNFKNSNVAVYAATNCELSMVRITRYFKSQNNHVFLPVVVGDNEPLVFRKAPIYNWNLLPKKSFNIAEPKQGRDYLARHMDTIFVPLLAFDGSLNRLGMGGGFYDRTLAQLSKKRSIRQPHLIGVGYDSQRYEGHLPTEKNDCCLDTVITPCKVLGQPLP